MFRKAVRRSISTLTAFALVAVALGTTACSFGELYFDDPLLRGPALMETQKRYTDLVRWSAFHQAAVYVEPTARDGFVAGAPSFKNFRFTDYESEPVMLEGEHSETTIRVTYSGYSTSSPFEVEVIETQHWTRDGVGNDWFVTSEFEGLEPAKRQGIARKN